jgi:hypothetical protein
MLLKSIMSYFCPRVIIFIVVHLSVILVMPSSFPVCAIAYQPFKSPLDSTHQQQAPHFLPYTSSVIGDYDPDHPLLTLIQPQNQPLVKNLPNPSVRAFDVQGNSTLHLKCTGSRDIVWTFPQNYIVSCCTLLISCFS